MLTRRDSAASTGLGLTSYSYDTFNRMLSEQYPTGKTNTYTYDLNGNLASLPTRAAPSATPTARPT